MTAYVRSMPDWMGKALGAAAALVFAPPDPAALLPWLAAAVVVGHGLDTLRSRRGPPAAAPRRSGAGNRASLRFTFAALGRIAAASGDVRPEHRCYAERLMARLAFPPERRREALVWFHAGRDPAFPFDALTPSCRAEFVAHPVLAELASQSLCRMAVLSDTPRATAELLTMADRVGWDRQALAAQATATAVPHGSAEDQARATLGVGPNDGPDVIRLAYRRRVARWHPDRLPLGTPRGERAAAEERMWRLREALDLLTGEPRAGG